MKHVCSNFLVALIALACFTIGCGAKPDPIIEPTPSERPLPPSSGTPIGFLIDDATKLSLRTDQLDKLRAIDDSLTARNDQLDARQRRYETMGVPQSERARIAKGRHRGKGGPHTGGPNAGGPNAGGPNAGGPNAGGAGAGSGAPHAGGPAGGIPSGPPLGAAPAAAPIGKLDATTAQRFSDEKDSNTLNAIAQALDVLDPDQRAIAEQILDEHGVKRTPDPAAGNAAGSAAGSGDEAGAVPYEP